MIFTSRALLLVRQICFLYEVFFSLFLETRTRIGFIVISISKGFLRKSLSLVILWGSFVRIHALVDTHTRCCVLLAGALYLCRLFVRAFVWRLLSENLAIVLDERLKQSAFNRLSVSGHRDCHCRECGNLSVLNVLISRRSFHVLALDKSGTAYWPRLSEVTGHKLLVIWANFDWLWDLLRFLL